MYLATNLRIYVLLHMKDKDEDVKGNNESEHTEAKGNRTSQRKSRWERHRHYTVPVSERTLEAGQ